jgi:ribulose-5-phosphate 4-epimerase/fuculose-1-phosphate aldolase
MGANARATSERRRRMNDLARQAANIADGWDVDVTEVAEIIERHGTLVSHEELERLRAYERELEAVSNILTNVHPMGAVKTIDKVRYMLTTYEEVCSLDEWHAWAANARKVT